jgi:uncharacterized membrane protein
MSWLVFAFSGPVLWAISTHFDKYLVEQYFKHSDTAVLLLFTALMGVLTLPFIAFYAPPVTSPGPGSIVLIMLSGVLYMGALLLYLRALQTEEASVVAPFFQAAPVFGYGLAYFVLGETLTARQLAGGALIVGGTLIVSLRFGRGAGTFKLRLVMLMLACGLALAVSGLIFKVFAITVEFWVTTFWLFVGEALFGCAILAIGVYRLHCRAQQASGGAVDDQRRERGPQSRRRAGIPLRAAVRPVEHRAGDRRDDDAVCLRVRRGAERRHPAPRPRDAVGRGFGAERRGGGPGRGRGGAGDARVAPAVIAMGDRCSPARRPELETEYQPEGIAL